jgi:hypothetical protein
MRDLADALDLQRDILETIERERGTTATVKQLRNELREEKQEHEEKVGGPDGSLAAWYCLDEIQHQFQHLSQCAMLSTAVSHTARGVVLAQY